MNKKLIENKFIDLVENTLSSDETAKLLKIIESDEVLSKKFNAYKELVSIENTIRAEEFSLNSNFSVKVLDKINSRPFFLRSIIMKLKMPHKVLAGSLATIAIAIIGVRLSYLPENHRLLTSPIIKNSDGVIETETKVKTTQDINKSVISGLTVPKEEIIVDDKSSPEQIAVVSKSVSENELSNPGEMIVASKKDSTVKDNGKKVYGQEKRRTYAMEAMPENWQLSIAPLDFKPHSISNERYGQFAENPRISVNDEAISTFSIDVDTGSYTNMRRFLRMGQLPPKDSVRIEEFINYFNYDYPVQYEKPFTFNYEISPSPLEKDRHLLKLGIKAKDAKISETPWNLVFLIDVSGSMSSPDKLGLVKQSLKVLLSNMRKGDKVSIVTYAGGIGVLLEGQTIDNRSEIMHKIDSLDSGGGTYGSAGIQEAYKIAKKHFINNGVNRVILATDGDFNVGVTNNDELIKLIEEKRKTGITLTTLGFGTGNYNEAMMEQLANKGNGNYFYIDSFKEATKVFETDLFGTIEVIAKDVKLQIEFNPEHISHYRLIGYDNRKLKKEDFNNDAVDAGEIGSGHTVTALYEVIFKDSLLAKSIDTDYRYQKKDKKIESKKSLSEELAFLKVRYKDPQGNKSKLLKYPISIKDQKSLDNVTADFKFIAAVSYFGHLLKDSQYSGEYSYEKIEDLARSGVGEDKLGYRSEFVELVRSTKLIANKF